MNRTQINHRAHFPHICTIIRLQVIEENPTVSTLINKVHSWKYRKKTTAFYFITCLPHPTGSFTIWFKMVAPAPATASAFQPMRGIEKQERYTYIFPFEGMSGKLHNSSLFSFHWPESSHGAIVTLLI